MGRFHRHKAEGLQFPLCFENLARVKICKYRTATTFLKLSFTQPILAVTCFDYKY